MGILGKIIGTMSGGMEEKLSEQLLFDKVIGFRGVKDGVGCSTFVFNTAIGLVDATKYNICVLDTHLLYPNQEFYLGVEQTDELKDIMDFNGENLAKIAYRTKYQNVYLVSFRERVLADLLSSKESQGVIDRLIDSLKAFFDIILIDLSHEPSWATTVAALKCNKIYTIIDTDIGCLSLMQKSLNSLASTGVSVFKMRKVILNKQINDVNTGIYKSLKEYDMELIAEVPFSIDIARFGVLGERIWGAMSNRQAVTLFNQAVDRLLDDICESNEIASTMIRSKDEEIPLDMLEGTPEENPDLFEEKVSGMSIAGKGAKHSVKAVRKQKVVEPESEEDEDEEFIPELEPVVNNKKPEKTEKVEKSVAVSKGSLFKKKVKVTESVVQPVKKQVEAPPPSPVEEEEEEDYDEAFDETTASEGFSDDEDTEYNESDDTVEEEVEEDTEEAVEEDEEEEEDEEFDLFS